MSAVEPEENWTFNEEVARSFDDMLARSIPQYETMRRAVRDFQTAFLPSRGGRVMDIGSSRGGGVEHLIESRSETEFTLIEKAPAMLQVLEERYGRRDNVYIRDLDITTRFPNIPSEVIQSILTLQFTPINYRQQLIQSIYDSLRDGGAFIFVEKVLGKGAVLDDLQDQFYHKLKRDHGYTYEDIDKKADSLERVLVPVTADWNVQMMNEAGFRHVDCFWRWMKFAGWIAVK